MACSSRGLRHFNGTRLWIARRRGGGGERTVLRGPDTSCRLGRFFIIRSGTYVVLYTNGHHCLAVAEGPCIGTAIYPVSSACCPSMSWWNLAPISGAESEDLQWPRGSGDVEVKGQWRGGETPLKSIMYPVAKGWSLR